MPPSSASHSEQDDGAVPMPPYRTLAAGYDLVMAHVDYAAWAEFIYDLLEAHCPDCASILELGCGTGSLALELQPMGPYNYVATDGEEQMIRVARIKASREDVPVTFEVADFTDFRVSEPVDAVLLLYDGVNYLLDDDQVRALLRCSYDALRPGGVFLFDQSTPANSINNESYFEDTGEQAGFSYVRRSRYDRDRRLHTTTFELSFQDQVYRERHVQRAYTQDEILALIDASPFEVIEALDGFSTDPVTPETERIHWLLRRPRMS